LPTYLSEKSRYQTAKVRVIAWTTAKAPMEKPTTKVKTGSVRIASAKAAL